MTRRFEGAPYNDPNVMRAVEQKVLGAEATMMAAILTEQFYFMPSPLGHGYVNQDILYNWPFPQIPELGATWRDGKEPRQMTHLEAVADRELGNTYRELFEPNIPRNPEEQERFLRVTLPAWFEAQAVYQMAENFRQHGQQKNDVIGQAAYNLFNQARWAYRDRILATESEQYIDGLKKSKFGIFVHRGVKQAGIYAAKRAVVDIGVKAVASVINAPIAGIVGAYQLAQLARKTLPKVQYTLHQLHAPRVVFDAAAEDPSRKWVTIDGDETGFHDTYRYLANVLQANNRLLEYQYLDRDNSAHIRAFPLSYEGANVEKTDALMTALFLQQGNREASRQYAAGVFLRYAASIIPTFLKLHFK